MKLIIAGTRTFNDYHFLTRWCNHLVGVTEVVSGKAPGADRLGERWAKDKKLPIVEFPAPWNDIEGKPEHEIGTRPDGSKFWKRAGHFRNGKMAEYADALIAFWDGKSTGTKNMIAQAKEHGLLVQEVWY